MKKDIETREKWLAGQKENKSTERTIAIAVGTTLATIALVFLGAKLLHTDHATPYPDMEKVCDTAAMLEWYDAHPDEITPLGWRDQFCTIVYK